VDARGADVINLSLTTPPTAQLAEAVRYALDRRAVVVAAAGNQSEGADGQQEAYPAAYPGVIAVAGVNDRDEHVASSTTGDYVDVAAPGERIAGPSPAGGGYLFTAEGGTSFATAYVSGIAALIRAYDPGLRPDQVAGRITETADHPASLWNPEVGHGVVNPARAVGALRPAGGTRAPGPDTADPDAAVAGRVQPPAPRADPQRAVKGAAGWITVVGAAAALLVLLAVPVVRLGRRRGWRPGRV
jgi:membrane-anchored mycosin MYCP